MTAGGIRRCWACIMYEYAVQESLTQLLILDELRRITWGWGRSEGVNQWKLDGKQLRKRHSSQLNYLLKFSKYLFLDFHYCDRCIARTQSSLIWIGFHLLCTVHLLSHCRRVWRKRIRLTTKRHQQVAIFLHKSRKQAFDLLCRP